MRMADPGGSGEIAAEGWRSATGSAPSRRVADWTPASMKHWPGCVAAVIRLTGCDHGCAVCLRPDSRSDRADPPDWPALLRHLHDTRDTLDGIVVTGGEPTSDPDLPSLLAALKDQCFEVRLDTKGSHPKVLSYVLAEGLADYVALEVKTNLDRYESLTGVPGSADRLRESIGVLLGSGVPHEFRTILHPAAVEPGDLAHIASELRGGMLYALDQYRPPAGAETLPAPYPAAVVRAAVPSCTPHLPTVARGLR